MFAVRLIITCALCAGWCLAAELTFDWHKLYNRIFGEDFSETLDDRQILSSLGRLAKSLNEANATQAERSAILFWSEVAIDPKECSFEYMRSLVERFEIMSEENKNSNFDRLEQLTIERTLKICGRRLENFKQSLMPIVESNLTLHSLDKASVYFRELLDNSSNFLDADEETIRYLAEYLLFVVGPEKRAKFIPAWREGACTKLINKLEGPDMKLPHDYVKMVMVLDLDPREYCDGETLNWVMIMQMCEHFAHYSEDLEVVSRELQKRDKEIEHVVEEDMLDYIDESSRVL